MSPPSIAVQKLDPTPPGQQPSRRRPSLSYRLWSEGGWIQDKLSTYLSEMFFSLSLSLLCHFGICLSISACLCHLKQEVSKKIRDGWHRQELGAEPNKGTDGAPGKMSGINLLSTTSISVQLSVEQHSAMSWRVFRPKLILQSFFTWPPPWLVWGRCRCPWRGGRDPCRGWRTRSPRCSGPPDWGQ